MSERKLGMSPVLGMGYHKSKTKWSSSEDLYKQVAKEIFMDVKSFTVSDSYKIADELYKLGIKKSQIINIETTRDLYCKVWYWA